MPDEAKKKQEDQKEQTAGTEGAATAPSAAAKAKKKIRRMVPKAIAHVQASFNNTIITIADANGDTLCWASAGTIGYKGSKKSTPYAAQRAAESVVEKARKFGVRELDVRVSGPGSGREAAIRALNAAGLFVRTIEDVTRLPHNGCRPRKKRRV
jgi:small subunit ribosomal protein S11